MGRRLKIALKTREAQKRLRKEFSKRRVEYPKRVITLWKETMRDRIEKTKALIDFRGYRGDFHMHSNHSDGASTVEDLVHYKEASGLDTIFVTDHNGVTQKRDCVRFKNVWWGQEPGTQHHHLGILGLDRKFQPKANLAEDYHRVIERGGVPFIPHPTGWFPTTRYSQEQIAALDVLGDEFAIEIINGANQVYDCFDVTDEMSIELWDRHLLKGKRVVALGCTDAHLCEAVGDVWTGFHADELSKDGVLDAIRRGRVFVSDAPLVELTVQADGGPIARMGEIFRTGPGPLTVRVLAADSLGLARVNLIRDGKVLRTWVPDGAYPQDRQVVSHAVTDTDTVGLLYYRLECFARDGRRAYSNPVYIRAR